MPLMPDIINDMQNMGFLGKDNNIKPKKRYSIRNETPKKIESQKAKMSSLHA